MDASEAFEYLPVAGMHSRWVVWVDDESTLSSYERLSDVEAEIETWVDETLDERGIEIARVRGSHGWRTFDLSDGTSLRFRWTHSPLDFRCVGCGGDTINEAYMVHDEVWEAAGFGQGWVCIGCMEDRLGRVLSSTDFKPTVPMNTEYYTKRSERLRDRLGGLLEKPESGPNITFTAPVASVDLLAFDDAGDAYEITSCNYCLPWRAEVVKDPETGETLVREWHAWECEALQGLLDDEDGTETP